MNKNENKSEVARQKILKYHFADEGNNANLFYRMPVIMMPFAMEWIGRTSLGFALMYNVVRGDPARLTFLILQSELELARKEIAELRKQRSSVRDAFRVRGLLRSLFSLRTRRIPTEPLST